jgi:hypothetical protein
METTTSSPSWNPEIDRPPMDREAILQGLEEYRTLLYEPLPAADVNEALVRAKIDTLLDRLHRLR